MTVEGGDVGSDIKGGSAERLQLLNGCTGSRRLAEVGDRQVEAGARQGRGDAEPDAAPPAGDERDGFAAAAVIG